MQFMTRMDRDGQVVIPGEIRDKLGLAPGESLLIADVDGRIILSSVRGESIREEYQQLVQEFDRQLAGQNPDVNPVDAVRHLRDGTHDL